MKPHLVGPNPGSRKPRRRVGRGTSAGQGTTAGKGTKGQLARSGPGLPGWFEGGQMPIHMRLPKLRGFKNRARVPYVAFNVSQLEAYAQDGKVTPATLEAKGLVNPGARLKVLGDGEPTGPFEVHAHAASATARAKIEAAGGSVVLLERAAKPGEAANRRAGAK
ncbi:MAG: 50S ribosomal protein L15 [Chloroflexi bacterium]|nr:50S ribosomal protein L15 [Chloroflexota bacterium]